jgi:hypothetical protein
LPGVGTFRQERRAWLALLGSGRGTNKAVEKVALFEWVCHPEHVVEAAGEEQVRLVWRIAFAYRRGSKALVRVAKLFARATPLMTKALRGEFEG